MMKIKTRNPLPPLGSGSTGFYNAQNEWVCTGSRMGRRNTLPEDRSLPVKLRLVRLRWVDGDYDQGGAYWGCSRHYPSHGKGYAPAINFIYRALGDCDEVRAEIFVRAKDRNEAKDQIRALLPAARFYR